MNKFSSGNIKRTTLSQQVLDNVVNLLMSGQLKPGDRLPSEFELMEQFAVSRPVLRESLSALETLEIVTRKPRDGTIINDKISSSPFKAMLALSINDVPAIIEARMVLELGLVTMACEKITDDELERLKSTIDAIEQNRDKDYGYLDQEFHRIIAEAAENPVVEGMIVALLIAHKKTDSLITYRDPDITIEHHLAIYSALQQRDHMAAYNAMYKHLSFVRTKILNKQ
ncbi:FadR/GntR family transcriptional regulator [Ureibacillus aquaedulcis]|uniref:FadR/GntR family transcriptional regulator n=1 Tax=Ureibacillus aquaedulcis TaxID=3058421 RepID=A0ABT8GMX6_9BACL|nr:FadR/GntR family transcriptional regulator [Ureibacillus sp. BA0131]MDN4492768.1 FadR/GntR family transcriptional regulator [Ureibacillus sp. BA0131]